MHEPQMQTLYLYYRTKYVNLCNTLTKITKTISLIVKFTLPIENLAMSLIIALSLLNVRVFCLLNT